MANETISIIDQHTKTINDAIAWSIKYEKVGFPTEEFKNYRRQIATMRDALTDRCAIAAYGESQVGKSYLMSSLLSSPGKPFVIENQGETYSFIDDLNPSGGSTVSTESTGVITRFTTQEDANPGMKNYVHVRNFSVVDIVLLLVDSFYNDMKDHKVVSPDKYDDQLQHIVSTCKSGNCQTQSIISEDDIRTIEEYIADNCESAGTLKASQYFNTLATEIAYIPMARWAEVFGIMWNGYQHFTLMLSKLLAEYEKIGFNTNVYIPFGGVQRSKGTLLDVRWLDIICDESINIEEFKETTIDIYDGTGQRLTSGFKKSYLAALTAEITFVLSPEITNDRQFLRYIDLLDFPGARSRENMSEKDVSDKDIPQLLRRGKVAYLFNKYSRALKLSSILFCFHNVQKVGPDVGNSINDWIEKSIGATPEARAESLQGLGGLSPLLVVATKFNMDLEFNKSDHPGELTNHWTRFSKLLPEIVTPHTWLETWVTGAVPYFRQIYPLRDFYWSKKRKLFTGYSDVKGSEHPEDGYDMSEIQGFPNYWDELKQSFVNHEFIRRHFSDPTQAWNDVATPNNDGSKAIIRVLDKIAPNLHANRERMFHKRLTDILGSMMRVLGAIYKPMDAEGNNKKVRRTIGRIKMGMAKLKTTKGQEAFGRIIDNFMVDPLELVPVVRDILVYHRERPEALTEIDTVRTDAGIVIGDSREKNLQRLYDYYYAEDEQELQEMLGEIKLNDVLSNKEGNRCKTDGDLVTRNIVNYWKSIHLNHLKEPLSKMMLPETEEIINALQNLFDKLQVAQNKLRERINEYEKRQGFSDENKLTVISDFASLVLNDFVNTIGREYMTPAYIQEVKDKAQACNIRPEDIKYDQVTVARPTVQDINSVESSLEALYSRDLKDGEQQANGKKLPFEDNFDRWTNLLYIGILLASNVPDNSASNEEIGIIYNNCKELKY